MCGYRIQLGCSIKAVASHSIFEKQLAHYSERNFAVIPDTLTKTIYLRHLLAELYGGRYAGIVGYSQAILSVMLPSGYSVSQSSLQ